QCSSSILCLQHLLGIMGLPAEVRVQPPRCEEPLNVVDALVTRALKILEAQTHFLVGVVQLLRAAASIPLRLERWQRFRYAAEVRAVAALVGPRISGKLDRAAGDGFLDDLSQVADLVVLFGSSDVEGLVVNQFARRFESRQKCAGNIFN